MTKEEFLMKYKETNDFIPTADCINDLVEDYSDEELNCVDIVLIDGYLWQKRI